MADHPSLADRAVQVLAEVAAMDRGVTVDDPERHIVWDLKNEAQQILSEAFGRAQRFVHMAETVRREMPEHCKAAQRLEGR